MSVIQLADGYSPAVVELVILVEFPMDTLNSSDDRIQVENSNPAHGLKLMPETRAHVHLSAQTPGNQLAMVEEGARADSRAAQGGGRTEAERKLEFAHRRKSTEETHLQEARVRLRHTEPKIILKGHRAKVGLIGWFVVLLLLAGLLIVLWNENGAAAQALLSTGAFDVDSIERARMVMLTPVAVGIAFILGFKVLPPFVRRRSFLIAFGTLVMAFATWAVCFAIQTEKFRDDSSSTMSLGSQGLDDSTIEAVQDHPGDGGWSAWLMFGCLAVIMALTTFIGHAGVEHYLLHYETWVTNPEYTRTLDDMQAHEDEIRHAEREITATERQLAAYIAEEEQVVTHARALYKSLKQSANGWAPIATVAVLLTGCIGGCGSNGNAGNDRTSKMERWASQSAKRNAPVTRVLAISPLLPAPEKMIAQAQLETEIAWIANDAPMGSVTVIVDGLECVPIARLEAVPGVSRIRKKSLAKPALAIREFLRKSHPRVKDDGRIHLPRLAQTAKQWRLPEGSHVVVLGNPLFHNDGKDKFFSMAGGQVPSDGCLFEDPKLNIYSVLGREKALAGQYWHLGWSNDAVFEDDTHRQAVLRFWFLYFQAQSARLVTAQPSFVAATEAAREGTRDPLMYADSDANSPAAMVKIVKVPHKEEVEIKPKVSEDAERRAETERAAKEAEAAAKAAQQEREAANVLREKEAQNELARIEAKKQEAANALRETERAAKEAEIAAKAAQQEREAANVLREKEAQNELARIEAKKQEAASALRETERAANEAETAAKAAQQEREAANVLREKEAQNELARIEAIKQQVTRDQHGNLKGSDKDLITDGQMKGQKILMATFYSDKDVEHSPLTGALTAKGFVVQRLRPPLPSLASFETMLDESQQLWLWSSAETALLPKAHLQAIVRRWKAGKLALCLLADNAPFTYEASAILTAIAPGSTIGGDYAGERTLLARQGQGAGFTSESPLFHNIASLYEGMTISTMSGPGLVPVCYASNGSPLIATLQQGTSSRLVVHGGFTSFYQRNWDDAGISRFAVNCAGWLSGADVSLAGLSQPSK